MTDLVSSAGSFAVLPALVPNEDGQFELNLRGTAVKDLQPLRGLPIAVLDLWGAPVTDFSPLAVTPVRKLILGGRLPGGLAVDYSTLKKVVTLMDLTIEDAPFRNLEDLAGLPLKSLNIPGTAVTDLAPLRRTKIRELNFIKTDVLDIRPLLEMDELRQVEISETVTNPVLLDTKPNLLWGPKPKSIKTPSNRRR